MAIFRCKECDYLKELPNQYLGRMATCPSCQAKTTVQDTLMTLANLLAEKKTVQEDNSKLKKHIKGMRTKLAEISVENQRLSGQIKQPQTQQSANQTEPGYAFANMDDAPELQNTQGVLDWFKQRHIEAKINERAIDISGYFDEVAVLLGDNFTAFKPILDKINWTIRKGFDKASYPLPDDSEEAKRVKKFCQTLYDYAFVAKYIHTKQNKVLLILNKERNIRKFFSGDWLEWYSFMKVVSLFSEKQIKFSYLRGFEIIFQNKEQRELDLFFLVDGKPLWIECKTGEFCDSIEKYSLLKKTLNIDKERAILLVSNLEEDKAKGFSHMFYVLKINLNLTQVPAQPGRVRDLFSSRTRDDILAW